MSVMSRAPIGWAAAAILVLFAATVWLQAVRDSRYVLPTSDEETLYLTQKAASRLVFTDRSLAADLYWIRALQYYGGRHPPERGRGPPHPPPAPAGPPPVTLH